MKKLLFLFASAGLFFAWQLTPETYTIQGKVLDKDTNDPLIAVNVSVKGTSEKTTTDENGNFKFQTKSRCVHLEISYVGYETVEIKKACVGKNITVKLKPGVEILNEVYIIPEPKKDEEVTEEAPPVEELKGRNTRSKTQEGQSEGVINAPVEEAPPAIVEPEPEPEIFRIVEKPKMTNAGALMKSTVPMRDRHETQPQFNTEDYDAITENRFYETTQNPLSTFSIDVDAASYSNMRRFIKNGQKPPKDAVRIEELVNYFDYEYPEPKGEHPFEVITEISECPWQPQHRLLHVGMQGKHIATENLPPSNLVFLIDVSGSMNESNKLPLVQASIKLLTDQLRDQDRVAMVVYAGAAGLVLPSTSGGDKRKIKDALDQLKAGGSTAGGEGIRLAYEVARQNFVKGGNNRVILATDGDFNVGASSDADMVQLIEKERESGVFLTVLGYGIGNYKDNKMQQLADKGNGNHAYIDDISEAQKVLVKEFGGTIFTIAKDVKLQIEFNPAKVQGYRLIGYENRVLNKEDFNDDKKDAGELGAGHTVTALYEIIPVGVESKFLAKVDDLKYQKGELKSAGNAKELCTIKLRYKKPDGDASRLLEKPVVDHHIALQKSSNDFRWSAAVAEFGMLLRQSEFRGEATYAHCKQLAQGAKGKDENGYRRELIEMIGVMQSVDDVARK
jgi:Ca-activated chloride channel family protein